MVQMYHNAMPRTVDHQQRRTHIAEALIRLAVRVGLHAVTMREVAAEAGVSLRLVQYYFETKAQLMEAALELLARRSNERWRARLARLGDPPPPRAFVATFLEEALPADEASRTFHLLWWSHAALAMTDEGAGGQPLLAGPARLQRQLSRALGRAHAAGELAPGVEPRLEAARLLDLSHGLGTSVLIGHRSVKSARAVLRYHLARVFA